ncbi:uncharacterized protein N7477_006317 [Penicillium maclennaniae]|uniref:uncharacterized protein n=1 Tax=Penicillium maclennaniae TaxID=1343394 RepID=UPI00253FF195|nr:uncharacterized protein N7477_006317 [Penicillium maclennaniae]KAJ5667747.1 hypothetical protein N7477_006317 [Penicillium maclennaniae]
MVSTRRAGEGGAKKAPDKPGLPKKGNVATGLPKKGRVATGRVEKQPVAPPKKPRVTTGKDHAPANTPSSDEDSTGSETGSDLEQLGSGQSFAKNPVATSNIRRSDLPLLAAPGPNQVARVTAAVDQNPERCVSLRQDFDVKWICRCAEEDHKDTRYTEFPRSGPVAIPPCAVVCPYCAYCPGLKATVGTATGRGGSIRKHIEKQHVNEDTFLGLYVVSLKDSKGWFNWKPPGRTGSMTAVTPAPVPATTPTPTTTDPGPAPIPVDDNDDPDMELFLDVPS